MSWNIKTFEELFDFQKKSKRKASAGKTEGSYAFYTSSPVLSKYTNEPDYNKPSLVFGTGGNASVHLTSENFSTTGDCLVATPKNLDELYLKFAFYFFVGNIRVLEKGFKGAGLKHISKAYISKIEIPLPPLSVQRKISAVLAKADILRGQCQQMEQELNTLVQSVFLKMFGEPTNYPGHMVKLNECIFKIESGWSPKCKTSMASSDKNGVLKLGAVTSGFYKEEENKEMLDDSEPKVGLEVQKGDLLFTRKNTFELVAATAYVRNTRSNLYLPDLIFRFVPKPGFPVSKVFLWALFSSKNFRKSIQSLATGAAGSMPNISKAKLAEVEIPMPPISQQEKFAAIVTSLWEVQDMESVRFETVDKLFESTIQRAFKGELELKDVA